MDEFAAAMQNTDGGGGAADAAPPAQPSAGAHASQAAEGVITAAAHSGQAHGGADAEGALPLHEALPHSVMSKVLMLLPADARARTACVCRGLCATLADVSLWARLDLSLSSGVRVRITNAVLAGAAAKARGQLTALDVSGCNAVTLDALLAAVRANGGALRELRCGVSCEQLPDTLERFEQLMLAAPHDLFVCYADVSSYLSLADARRMLRNEPPFQPLRLGMLHLWCDAFAGDAPVLALAPDLAAHASLTSMSLESAPLQAPAALDAVVDVALSRQLVTLALAYCRLSPDSAPALVRLLGSGALKQLTIIAHGPHHAALLDGPSAALLSAALRANRTLTGLSLVGVRFWQDADAAAALLSALTGHPSLRTLCLGANRVDEAQAAAAGAALGALVSANAHALTVLHISDSSVGESGLRPLFEALPANTHLHTLNVVGHHMSEACARGVLLPALRANTGLRQLLMHNDNPEYDHAATFEAHTLVKARGAAAAAV
jgi:hypothetical protein